MRRPTIAWWLAAALYSIPAVAQTRPTVIDARTGLTLEQAIAEGLRAEPGLRAAASNADAARGEMRQAALRPNPTVSFEQREQFGGTDRQTTIGVDAPLDVFRRAPRIQTARSMADSAAAGLEDARRLLAAAIREQYGETAAAARRLEVLDAVLAASRRTHELLRDRVAEGATPPIERDIALLDVRRLEGDRELAAGRVAVAVSRLKTLLGRPPTADLTLAQSLESIVAAAPASDGYAVAERADVRQAAADLAAATAGRSAAAQEAKPDIGIFGAYMRMDAGFPQQGLGPAGFPEPIHGLFNNASVGVRLTVPIFNRGQGSVAAARARELSASATLDARRLAVLAETSAASARLDAARRALASYAGETRALAERNVDVVRETYTLGRATLFDVLNEQRRFLEFEAGYTDALVEAFLAASDLKRAQGELQ